METARQVVVDLLDLKGYYYNTDDVLSHLSVNFMELVKIEQLNEIEKACDLFDTINH